MNQDPAEPRPALSRSVQVPKPDLGVKGELYGSGSFGDEGSSSAQPPRFIAARTGSPCGRAQPRRTLRRIIKSANVRRRFCETRRVDTCNAAATWQ